MSDIGAKAIVDNVIDRMHPPGDDLLLLERDVWDAFIAETGLRPEALNGDDEEIRYRSVGLRRSATS